MLEELNDQIYPTFTRLVQDSSDQAIHAQDLDSLHDVIETLMEKGTQTLQQLPMSDTTTIMQDEIHAELESYVMEQTYDVVFFKITQVVLSRDLHLSEVIEQIKHVDVTQLGLPPTALHHAHSRVKRAVTIFQKISAYRTPFEKLECILSTIQSLSSSSPESAILDTSDTLIPLLLLTVIQSRVAHLSAHWTFMKEYTFELDVIGGKYGFALSTLEGVLVYLADSAIPQLAAVSRNNLQLWRCLKTTTTTTMQQQSQQQQHYQDVHHMETLYNQSHPVYSTLITSTPTTPCTPTTSAAKALVASGNNSLSFVIRDRHGNTPLLLACRSGHLDYIPFLARYERVTTVTNENGETALMMAVRSGSVALVEHLLTQYEWTSEQLDARVIQDEDANQQDIPTSCLAISGQTVVHLAASSLHYTDSTLLDLLVCGGATLDLVDTRGNGPLHLACLKLPSSSAAAAETTTRIIDYLLEHLPSSAIRQSNNNGDTFFHLCQDQDLLYRYQDQLVDSVNEQGRSPWLSWAESGRFQIMLNLLDHHGVDQFRLDYEGRSGLHYVASQLYLLEQQSNSSRSMADNDNGDNSTILPTTTTTEDFIRQFADALRDMVYVRDRTHGNTPLHLVALSSSSSSSSSPTAAKQKASMETCRMLMESLLSHGADMNAYNQVGERPIDICDATLRPFLESWCLKLKKTKAVSDHHLQGNALHPPWALTRVVMDPVRYIVKSGKWTDVSSMTMVERTWDDFLFLRQEILHELPESFLPTLGNGSGDGGDLLFMDPCLLDLGPPPLLLLQKSARRLDQFMDHLQHHPTLRNHDQVRAFIHTPHLNKAAIRDKSYSKRNLMIEKLGATVPSFTLVDDFDEVYFLKYSQGMIQSLKNGLSISVQQAQQLVQCQQGFNDALDQVTQGYGQLTWLTKAHQESIKICASLACNTMYVCPFISLVDTLETMNDTSSGVLLALDHPFTLLKRKSELTQQLEKQRDALQKGQHPPWNGLFSTTEQTKQVEREKENIAKTLATLGTTTNQINQSHQMISDELAHYQRLHPDDMMKSIRSYARRQLKMEKLKLRWLTQTWIDVCSNER
ncbi:hypothetical protein BCR42DRAFT_418302 [Absidia repens]|uniref:VPS9 domain-containing protein n=1 Tax=Absidia repens TaxID=90262 RepID=A0A1X2ID42_9FUNG|nr:hypothetical protein BCR42DRAFT_418302 [Absidia repens]